MNLKRRHLTEGQRGMVAARLAKLPHGGDRRSDQAANLPVAPTQEQVADMLSVSDRTIRTAKVVQEQGTPELVAAVDSGKVAVSLAADIARLPEPAQRLIDLNDKKAVLVDFLAAEAKVIGGRLIVPIWNIYRLAYRCDLAALLRRVGNLMGNDARASIDPTAAPIHRVP